MNLPSLEDLEHELGGLAGKRVIFRGDYNVPLKDGQITDDLRIRATLPSIEWLQERGAELTLCSHLGRPKGPDPEFSLEPVAARLKELGITANLLDNLRFSPGEDANDPEFVRSLADGHDGYVNDAFAFCHRAAASIVGLAEVLPSAAGRSVGGEVELLDQMLSNSGDNFIAVLGGLKISDKLPVVEALLSKVDGLCIGGAMAFTFLAAQGINVGDSLVEESMIDKCREFLESDTPIHLPSDFVAMASTGTLGSPDDTPVQVCQGEIPNGWMAADVGPDTGAEFSQLILEATTVFWNGPVGAFEDPRFAAGTSAVADAMAESEAFTVVGGGDSAAAAKEADILEEVDHVSLGGGACLKYIEDGDLVGLKALRNGMK